MKKINNYLGIIILGLLVVIVSYQKFYNLLYHIVSSKQSVNMYLTEGGILYLLTLIVLWIIILSLLVNLNKNDLLTKIQLKISLVTIIIYIIDFGYLLLNNHNAYHEMVYKPITGYQASVILQMALGVIIVFINLFNMFKWVSKNSKFRKIKQSL